MDLDETQPLSDQDRYKPYRKKVNKSGYVLQIAVEDEIRRTIDSHGWRVVESEVPAGDGYLDLLLQFDDRFLAAVECKALNSEDPWIFLLPERAQKKVHRCRLEWFNGRAENLKDFPADVADRVMCDEFNMELASPEVKYAVTRYKSSTVGTLEAVSSRLLYQAHELLADEDRVRDSDLEVSVPIIITTVPLLTCSFSTAEHHLQDGVLKDDEGAFEEVPFVRFRKSLVPGPSDWYSGRSFSAAEMYAESTRTVFVVQAKAIVSFLDGLGSLRHQMGLPPRFSNPPRRKGVAASWSQL